MTKFGNNGTIDNVNYLKEHVRDTAQPKGRTGKVFSQFYKPVKNIRRFG